MRQVVLLATLTGLVFGIDVIIESLKQLIDKRSDPCDNFYRHVCPLNSTSQLIQKTIHEHKNKKTNGVWNQFEIVNVNHTVGFDSSLVKSFSNVFKDLCKKKKDTDSFLKKIMKILDPKEGYCHETYCLDHLKFDPNCERAGDMLKTILEEDFEKGLRIIQYLFAMDVARDFDMINAISVHLDENLEDGIKLTRSLLERIKEIAIEQIKVTPWTTNNDATNITINVVEKMTLGDDYGKLLRDALNRLVKKEFEYRACKQDLGTKHKDVEVFCFLYVAHLNKNAEPVPEIPFYNIGSNAGNIFPFVNFGFPFYYLAKNTKEMAAMLGAHGFVVGHELAHTLIESEAAPRILTYFSDNATQCIQNQYKSTCDEFVEKSCEVDDVQIDENGSDILGLQLAYAVLEKEYGTRLFEVYEPLNVTYQQLFFYSTVVFFCDGEEGTTNRYKDMTLEAHSPNYIRMNAMVNHPAFKEAFQCSDESRMIKSATEQCIIYGKNAPQNKRH